MRSLICLALLAGLATAGECSPAQRMLLCFGFKLHPQKSRGQPAPSNTLTRLPLLFYFAALADQAVAKIDGSKLPTLLGHSTCSIHA
jgi:hypothetical protein